jgi:K+-transporting ATPase c subunit
MNLGRGGKGSSPSTNELADGASASRNHSSTSPALTDRVSFRHLQQRWEYNSLPVELPAAREQARVEDLDELITQVRA